MGRLIDADYFTNQEVLEQLRTAEFDDEIIDIVNQAPTICDIDEIINEFESFAKLAEDRWNAGINDHAFQEYRCWVKAIEVVKNFCFEKKEIVLQNEQKPVTNKNQILPSKKEEFKITKNKYYRVNFSYKGKHYSVQEMGDLYDEYIGLTCKEDKNFFVNLGYDMPNLIPVMKHGQTYKDTDLSGIQEIIDKYIENRDQNMDEYDDEIER